MMMVQFINLLHIALGHRSEFSQALSNDEWQRLFLIAKKQALLGITFYAIEHLPAEQRPPRQLLLQWGMHAERIKERNIFLNSKAIEISQKFLDDGFRNIILKGQGIAKYYEISNLGAYRTPGDIDIWFEGSRKEIARYVRGNNHDCKVVYHHVDFPKIDTIDIEVHFTPSWMNNFFSNRKLQKFFNSHRDELFSRCVTPIENIPTPSLAFNRIYILIHIYRHLFHEGIGLRQLMDYYFVLRQGVTQDEKKEVVKILQSLKMCRFTGAIMWILQKVFGMEDKYLLTAPIENDGRFILDEIMKSGNLGLHDTRIIRGRNESSLSHGIRKVKRNFKFVWNYPSEVLWSPLFKIWHLFWRLKYNKHLS